MEQPFYHDDAFLSAYHHHHHGGGGHPDAAMLDYKLLKHNMNHMGLNLASLRADADVYRSAAGHRDVSSGGGSLRLAAPELERLIIQNGNGGVLTTPTPGPYFYNRGITDEQEGFAEGFVKALDDLHKMNMPPPNVSLGPGVGAASCGPPPAPPSGFEPAAVYTTLDAYCPDNNTASATTLSCSASTYPTTTISYLPHGHAHQQHTHAAAFPQHPLPGAALPGAALLHPLKEEPQTVPDLLSSEAGSPPMSPINMENQERIKAERKRLRNRQAATKCRRRKLERIARLEEKVKALKSDNAGLSSTASVLRDQVARLKQKVLTHVSSGCQLVLASKMEAF